jgi:putative addiction module component
LNVLNPTDREALTSELLRQANESARDEIETAWLGEAKARDAAYIADEIKASPVEHVVDELLSRARR